MIQLMIDSFKPDYMTLMMEPQTESYNLANLINNSPDSAAALVNYFLQNLQKGATKLGAGAGTWDDIRYFYKFSLTAIDFINFHVYPIQNGLLTPRMFSLDSLAKTSGKQLVCGESWLYKISNSELGSGGLPVATSSAIFSRDFYDYWADLDTMFFGTMTDFSQQAKLEAVNFFWPSPFWGQLSYNSTYGAMSYAQQIRAGQQYGFGQLYKFKRSPLGDQMKQRLSGICKSTAVNEINSTDVHIQVFPNPANRTLNIRMPDKQEEPCQLIITDALGRILLRKEINRLSENTEVDVHDWQSGIYFIRIRNTVLNYSSGFLIAN
jgi:hypothetical protein